MTGIRGVLRRGDAAGLLPIIPKPRHIQRRPGSFSLKAADTGLMPVLDSSLGPVLGPEGYRLTVGDKGVQIRAAAAAGALYAMQTLRQLMPADLPKADAVEIPCVEIEDAPRFAWRGFMLDEGRFFHGKDTVKLLLDLMLLHKLNVFHWHLTEDQGWRIEIRRYPELTRVGSARKGSTKSLLFGGPDGVPHAGFYTQDDIREIVAYAAERSITVVPEVDLPGHARSALAAYPWLGCTRGPYAVWDRVGIQPEIMCAGRESTFELLQGVLEEVTGLFPGPWVHIGGDEAPKARWKNCPDCRQRMESLGISDPDALQTWMTNRVAAFLRERGKGTIVWNDSLSPDLDPEIMVHYWLRGRREVAAAAQKGRRILCSSFGNTYLDHSYAFTPLSRAYLYEPVFPELGAAAAAGVLGMEAPLWTEMVPDLPRLWYQTFPRLSAYAETAWTPREQKDLTDFSRRLPHLLALIRARGAAHASLREAEPGPLRRLLGPLTIFQEQTGTARA